MVTWAARTYFGSESPSPPSPQPRETPLGCVASSPCSATRRQHRRRDPRFAKGKQAEFNFLFSFPSSFCDVLFGFWFLFFFPGSVFLIIFFSCPQVRLMIGQRPRVFPCPLTSRTNCFSALPVLKPFIFWRPVQLGFP